MTQASAIQALTILIDQSLPRGLEDAMEVTQKFTFNPKEGIDNPALVISDDTEPELRPRLCLLKREEGQSFGFYLCQDKGFRGHKVQHVDLWSTACRSGLRDGDHILEVNGEFVDNKDHSAVVLRIQTSGLQLCLLVLTAQEYELAVSNGQDLLALSRAHRGETCARPRLCHIIKEADIGLGIRIIPIEGEKGKYCVNPVPESPAEKAGVRLGDRLIWINGVRVSTLTHSALAKMVKKCEHVTVLVIDRESEQSYISRKLPILPCMASSHNLPHRPKTMHLVQGPQGYGFLLRQEKLSSGRIAHILREVDPGSPAEGAGMEDGDLLLAVNTELVETTEHEYIVSRVRKSGQQVTLTTISLTGREYYTQLGISPMMFYEDHIHKREARTSQHLGTLPHKDGSACSPCPRLCVLEREGSEYGFKLCFVENEPGAFIGKVEPGSSGERGGLLEGDVVVEVNGQNVEDEMFEDVVKMIKNGRTSLRLLVVEQSGYKKLKESGQTISPGLILHSTEVPDSTQDDFV
ncbi:Na(+)/H(+) exchange regulatory cofactor NHE-RF3 [Chanos chanos]|uniref:Na(+)/H(+) exchange regulatory cofactor NHE-RF3 n=1 Tax=Chanos chanos TaxID=29144 RepID=A0A6J2VLW2_CHACN|nr:Na(+)/H(+) exchange regulatory cofactor NHE-RF4 [Chanos chanos]